MRHSWSGLVGMIKFYTCGSKQEVNLKMTAAVYYVVGYIRPLKQFLFIPNNTHNSYLITVPYSFLDENFDQYAHVHQISQYETPPFRDNWKAPFSHLSVTIQSTEWQVHFSDHSVTIQCHSVPIPSPFRNIHFPFFPPITILICIYASFIWC